MLGAATSGDAVARFSKFSLFGFGKSDAATRVLTEDLLIANQLLAANNGQFLRGLGETNHPPSSTHI